MINVLEGKDLQSRKKQRNTLENVKISLLQEKGAETHLLTEVPEESWFIWAGHFSDKLNTNQTPSTLQLITAAVLEQPGDSK